MNRIRILPEVLSNKIAAGEVVERPSSVVKELVENSIDAGSSKIIVEVEKGGRDLIRVSDNGTGMRKDDALLAIERYATSKIETDDDLFSIRTLGFRGEALPSIASVSSFTLATRDSAADTGTQIHIEGGRIKNVVEAGIPCGTMISVRQLFYNTPARRKFLKTVNTEMGHITDTLSSIALGKPHIHFRLIHNGKTVKTLAGVSDPADRVTDILGQTPGSEFYPVRFQGEEPERLAISGFISSPGINRSSSRKIFIYVNGRHVRDRGVVMALIDGYRGRLMKGKYPVAAVFISISPELVDVNVHPAKSEIRFAVPGDIHRAVRESTSRTLLRSDRPRPRKKAQPTIPSGQFRYGGTEGAIGEEKSLKYAFSGPERAQPDPETVEVYLPASEKKTMKPDLSPPAETSSARETDPILKPEDLNIPDMVVSEKETGYISQGSPVGKNKTIPERTPVITRERPGENPAFFQTLIPIAQLHNTYIICHYENGMILIDQHAAHERVVFEGLKKKSDHSKKISQRLLIPETIDLDHREAAVLEGMREELASAGFVIEPFGGNTFAVEAVPAILSEGDVRPVIMEIIDSTMQTGYRDDVEKAMEEALVLISCHGAIRAGQPLSMEQIKRLLLQLDSCDNPSYCPHGRPTWIEWSLRDLEKSFRRVV